MGIIDNELVFAGKSSKDFNIFCSGLGSYGSPAHEYEIVKIAGKIGNELRDKKTFSNVEVAYKCLIYGDIEDFERFRAFLNSQSGYQRLEDTMHPDEYRMAVYTEALEPNIKGDTEGASFSLVFNCKPQRFLKDGEKTYHITTSGQLMNNTLYEAKPLIRVYEDGAITINGKALSYSNVSGYIDIDCEKMDAYKGSTNMNRYVLGTFPTLTPGLNTISCTGSIDIIPRWWTL